MTIWMLLLTLIGLSSSQTASSNCVPLASLLPTLDLTLEDMQTYATFAPRVLDYLNAGGDPEALQDIFDQLASGVDYQGYTVQWGNVMGDDSPELLIHAYTNTQSAPQSGFMMVYTCVEQAYRVYQAATYSTETGPIGAVGVFAIQDVTGDEQAEIIVSTVSTRPDIFWLISRLYIVWHWDGEAFVMITPFQSPEGYPSIGAGLLSNNGTLTIADTDGDTIPDMFIETAASRHGDPLRWSRLNRGQVAWYQWDGESIQYRCAHYAPPTVYRIHALLDANSALSCNDVEGAIVSLQQMIEDDSLLTWTPLDNRCAGCHPDRYPELWEKARQELEAEGLPLDDSSRDDTLRAYAYYRLALIHLWQGDTEAATVDYATLQAIYPDYPYTRLAARFREIYDGDYDAACTALREMAVAEGIQTPLVDYRFTDSGGNIPYDVLCPVMPKR
ncbi:MAG: hypothetical protein H6673_05170 [Anaerolineales bacterium]|nr:hypothetical protein [Anaerolineales bacterium]